jgi:hypothetical protein
VVCCFCYSCIYAYCNSQLLRLRGALTSRGELALAAMAKRHSPALLAAIEAYGANQVMHQPLSTIGNIVRLDVRDCLLYCCALVPGTTAQLLLKALFLQAHYSHTSYHCSARLLTHMQHFPRLIVSIGTRRVDGHTDKRC